MITPLVLEALGVLLGVLLGVAAGRLADVLPRRYGITALVTGRARTGRNLVALVATVAVSAAIAHVLAGTSASASGLELTTARALGLLTLHATVAAMLVAGALIDFEHMILPDELTYGAAVLCLLSSPFRSLGGVRATLGALLGLALTFVPFVLYKKLRGRSGMGLGDTKLAIVAGAWFGPFGVALVLGLGVGLMLATALGMRALRVRYRIPASVVADIEELRARAAAGDRDAAAELEDDPLAATPDDEDALMTTSLPLGPFLVAASLAMLFAGPRLEAGVMGWLFG